MSEKLKGRKSARKCVIWQNKRWAACRQGSPDRILARTVRITPIFYRQFSFLGRLRLWAGQNLSLSGQGKHKNHKLMIASGLGSGSYFCLEATRCFQAMLLDIKAFSTFKTLCNTLPTVRGGNQTTSKGYISTSHGNLNITSSYLKGILGPLTSTLQGIYGNDISKKFTCRPIILFRLLELNRAVMHDSGIFIATYAKPPLRLSLGYSDVVRALLCISVSHAGVISTFRFA
ncbi:hypothetical protein L218DRAFT_992342 [Marasmius fiardii PR-910]|nr:hypothetical protein L218DRAFT_992342 [Marasmius fiardii PR-910]